MDGLLRERREPRSGTPAMPRELALYERRKP
jgi:hypothetical protein